MYGVQLCSYFAYKPNALKYCGKDSAVRKIYNCITEGACDGLEGEFSKFKGLYPYLLTISEKFGLRPLDPKVVEAYWIGNELLNEFSSRDFYILLGHLKNQGVPRMFLDKLKKKFKNTRMKFIPHHSFNVLFVGVGNVTGSVEYNLENINKCLIRWGKFEEDNVVIKSKKLIKRGGRLTWKDTVEEVGIDKEIIPDLKAGESVAIHWKEVCSKLEKEEVRNLEKYINTVLDEFNKAAKLEDKIIP